MSKSICRRYFTGLMPDEQKMKHYYPFEVELVFDTAVQVSTHIHRLGFCET